MTKPQMDIATLMVMQMDMPVDMSMDMPAAMEIQIERGNSSSDSCWVHGWLTTKTFCI